MARLYHVDIARHAAGADHKWVDNLLSRFDIIGVEGGRQGAARRITGEGIQHIALVRLLSRELGLSVSGAVRLAERVLADPDAHVKLGGGLDIRLDRHRFQQEVGTMVAEAVESVTPARRGRPRKTI